MRINRPLEKEQARCAGSKWDGDSYKHTLTRSKNPTHRTKGDAPRHVGIGRPVQIALITCTGKHACEADKCTVSITVEMSNYAHRRWS